MPELTGRKVLVIVSFFFAVFIMQYKNEALGIGLMVTVFVITVVAKFDLLNFEGERNPNKRFLIPPSWSGKTYGIIGIATNVAIIIANFFIWKSTLVYVLFGFLLFGAVVFTYVAVNDSRYYSRVDKSNETDET